MNKISVSQAVILLVCCRIFRIMTFNPFEDTSGTVAMLAVLISAVVECILIIPVIVLTKRGNGANICEQAYERSHFLGAAVSVLYGLFFLLSGVRTARYFSLFIHEAFPGIKGKAVIAFLLILIAMYGAYLGIESLGRSSVFVFVTFLIMFVLMIVTTSKRFDLLNFSMTQLLSGGTVLKTAVREAGMNTELIMLTLLVTDIKGSIKKTAYVYIGTKAVLVLIIMFICTAILGNYLSLVKLPFFAVGAYSKTRLIERYDGLYLVIWTLCALVCLSLSAYIIKMLYMKLFRRSHGLGGIVLTGIVCFVLTAFFSVEKSSLDRQFDEVLNACVIVFFTFVVPLVFLAVKGKNKSVEEK